MDMQCQQMQQQQSMMTMIMMGMIGRSDPNGIVNMLAGDLRHFLLGISIDKVM